MNLCRLLLLPILSGLLLTTFTSCETTSFDSQAESKKSSLYSPKVNQRVLKASNKKNTKIVVDISKQKAYLLVNGKIAITSAVSTARKGKRTPRGNFRITQRVRSGKISTIYRSQMPYWMRLSGSLYGVHAGHLPGYPASAGCVRLPNESARLFFDNTSYGTRVSIYSSWSGAPK